MHFLLYVRLIGFTAGTLLQLFWMVVILGYRRQRNFERVFFFLCLALFFFYGGSLLALNAQVYYSQPPALLTAFAWALLCMGLCFLPPLLVHLHLEYSETRQLLRGRARKRLWLAAFYVPVVYFGLQVYPILLSGRGFDFLTPGNSLGRGFGIWLGAALVFSSVWEMRFSRSAPDDRQEIFHRVLASGLLVTAFLIFELHVSPWHRFTSDDPWISTGVALFPIVPLGGLIYYVQKFNFLQIGRQRNLVYAISVTFFALLYLSLVRRVGIWLEPMLPPEASAAILLFILVIFFEPLQRFLGKRLHETAQTEIDRTQRITSAIREVARQGNLEKLRTFVELGVKEMFELSEAGLTLFDPEAPDQHPPAEKPAFHSAFPIEQAGRMLGVLQVKPHGAMLSGETAAALEFLCEQLPATLDLCRLIEEKLQLERELAERERLAALGQMAASISHNLKNPLGSMKTILQLQLESAALPETLRGETRLVVEEIDRLSTKLNQLLRFSRPAVWSGGSGATCDAREVGEAVTSVLRHEAERRGVCLDTEASEGSLRVAASAEAVNEILSNLVVNALEATPKGGHVTLRAAPTDGGVEFAVEDDGAGISPGVRERILRPFFTTKAQGTGLGLAIVERRVAEFGGKLEWESPVRDSRGTRFRVWLPAEDAKPAISGVTGKRSTPSRTVEEAE